ncbi:MAG: twin-arginine translocase TatA/TatE family subunit [Dehalococcoidia bacterium]
MFRSLGLPELVIILVIILLIFGAGKLPQVGGALGKSIREFRKGQAGELDGDPKKSAKTPEKSEAEKKD